MTSVRVLLQLILMRDMDVAVDIQLTLFRMQFPCYYLFLLSFL